MAAQIIDGSATAKEIRAGIKEEVSKMETKPGLVAIIVGNNPESELYVSFKEKACDEVGIYHETIKLPQETTQNELLKKVEELNNDSKIHGILVQMPLPEQIDEQTILDAIKPEKDVDGLGNYNMGRLMVGNPALVPATPAGVMGLLEAYKIDLEGKHAVVIGRSTIVGKSLSLMLQMKNATVTMCHSRSKPLENYTKQADILCVAIGKAKLVTKEMVKKGAVVIDVGINRGDDGKVVGDVDFEEVKEVASKITPVPGGAGPMTIAMLLRNTVDAAKL